MDEPLVHYLVTQLGYTLPSILVYLVGFVLAIINIRRAPVPAVLTLVSVGLMFLATLATVALQAYVIHTHRISAGPGNLMSLVGVGGACARAAGVLMLVIAVFLGRKSPVDPPVDTGGK
jgi:hypothetical protein